MHNKCYSEQRYKKEIWNAIGSLATESGAVNADAAYNKTTHRHTHTKRRINDNWSKMNGVQFESAHT